MSELAELQSRALALPPQERIELANALWDSVAGADPDRDQQNVALAKKRLQELEDGTAREVPHEKVLRQVRQELG